MSSNRPIHLDLGMPSGSTADASHTAQQQPHADQRNERELDADAQILRERMKTTHTAPGMDAAPHQPAQAAPLSDLFGATSPALSSLPTDGAGLRNERTQALQPELDKALADMATRLLVSDGSHGKRSVQLSLANDALPGVSVEVFEEGGDIVAVFTCALEESRALLAQSAQWLVDEFSARLGRSACVRVQTDDPEDPAAIEARADH